MGTLPECIAIDGPAASGKSTVGKAIAKRFGYRFLDTGLMYRAVTLAGIRSGIAPVAGEVDGLLANLALRIEPDGEGSRVYLGEEDVTPRMRDPEVEAKVSAYSAIAEVRTEMVRVQREFARSGPSVLVGRDIGTDVLPDAPLKFYLEASETARAERGRRASHPESGIGAAGHFAARRRGFDSRREPASPGRQTRSSSTRPR